jgi:hypothetical protein
MKNIFNTIIITIVALNYLNAQSSLTASQTKNASNINVNTANYFAVSSDNWNNAATWSTIYGGMGGDGVPGVSDNVVICPGYNVTVNANAACNNLTIESGATLSCSNFDLSVNGATNVFGTFADNNDKGTDTFIGAVYIYPGGVWNTSPVTTYKGLMFRNGITHNGTSFQAGTAIFIINDQSLAGNSPMSFNNNVTISGNITLSNQNTSSITINGALDGLAGNTWKNCSYSSLYYSNVAAPMAHGTFDVIAKPNTVYYSLNGEQGIKATAYYNIVCTAGKTTISTSPIIMQANEENKIQPTGKLLSQQN